jgi:hypothetical protein
MPYLIIEARSVKRLSKKVKKHYMILEPGGWIDISIEPGCRVQILSSMSNTKPMYAGRSDQKIK